MGRGPGDVMDGRRQLDRGNRERRPQRTVKVDPLEEQLIVAVSFVTTSRVWAALPDVLAMWHSAGIMDRGTATWWDVAPADLTYAALMDSPGLPTHQTSWRGGLSDLVAEGRRYAPHTLQVPISWPHGAGVEGGLMFHFDVGRDESVELQVETSLVELFDGLTDQDGRDNLHRFIDIACLLFEPRVFVIGHLDVEASLGDLADLIGGRARPPTDWAFYGAALTPSLRQPLRAFRARVREAREIPEGGLFVRWTDWGRVAQRRPPASWTNVVATALARLGREE